MALRRPFALVLALVAVTLSTGAYVRTPNFYVDAPTPEIAQKVGQLAEHYRREKAIEWLGQEMPTWARPCPLKVTVSPQGPSGATSFTFAPGGGVTSQSMEIKGELERLLNSVLPHEVTHTVFAYYFRRPVPRWADEGGSVLSEDDLERDRHDKLVRQILNRGGQFPLRTLFAIEKYPPQHEQVMCLYAQGFSLSHYLVYVSDRRTFLGFVAHGMTGDWDGACRKYFGMKNVEELEATWLKHLRDTKGVTPTQLAQLKKNGQAPGTLTAANNGQAVATTANITRLTAPPAQPLAPVPVIRAQAPEDGQGQQKFGDPRQGQQPYFMPPNPPTPTMSPAPSTWQPGSAQQYVPVPVQLGTPRYNQGMPTFVPSGGTSTPTPAPVSPVGYPG
jgi:hypothetical protein